jgi:hypothetical protein
LVNLQARTVNWPSLTVGLLTLLLVCSCNTGARRSGIPAGAQAALDAAIQDIDAGRYDQVYEEASDEWKAQSLEQSKSALQTVRDKLGRARTRDVQTAREEQTSTGPVPGHSMTVIYQTAFDRGEGMETFTLTEHSGRFTRPISPACFARSGSGSPNRTGAA